MTPHYYTFTDGTAVFVNKAEDVPVKPVVHTIGLHKSDDSNLVCVGYPIEKYPPVSCCDNPEIPCPCRDKMRAYNKSVESCKAKAIRVENGDWLIKDVRDNPSIASDQWFLQDVGQFYPLDPELYEVKIERKPCTKDECWIKEVCAHPEFDADGHTECESKWFATISPKQQTKTVQRMTQKEFNKLGSVGQFKWLIENKDQVQQIELDNDITYIILNAATEEEPYITTMNYLGWDAGVKDLLTAIGFNAQGV